MSNEQNATEFSNQFDHILVSRHQGLRVEGISQVDGGFELCIASNTAVAHQHLSGALDDEELRRFLLSWSDGDLIVSVRGPDQPERSPALFIRDGTLGLVSGDDRGSAVPVALSFADWFQKLVGAALPIEFELMAIGQDLWGSSETRGMQVEGYPHTLCVPSLHSYSLAGYAGYGTSSYALYFTRVSGDTRLFLRLPWGGAYMKPEQMRPRLLGALVEGHRLFEEAARQKLPMHLNNNMGDWHFDATPERSRRRGSNSLQEAQRYVDSKSEPEP